MSRHANLEDYGRYAYEEYCRKLTSDNPPVKWDDLSSRHQRAWIAAALHVLDIAGSVGDL